jgi:tetratricopeptide (TPR) repeat protein
VNEAAAEVDRRFLATAKEPGVYGTMYYSHNLQFLAYANCMKGDFAAARRAADLLVTNVQPHLKEMPMLEGLMLTPVFVLITFERWQEILKLPAPDRSLLLATANWHFARALAFASMRHAPSARDESKAFLAAVAKLPRDAMFDPLNSVVDVTRVEENLLAAFISRSDRENGEEAEEGFTHAIAAEDALNYSEPPSWYPPIRPLLGRALLEEGKAAAAEKVFRSALERSPRYRPALAGLRDSLRAQNRLYDAEQIEEQLRIDQGVSDAAPSSAVSRSRR